MASQNKDSRSGKMKLVTLVAVIGVAFLLYSQRTTLGETWDTLRQANLWYVALLPVVQIINYFFIGTYYRKMFAGFGANISVARSWGVVSAMNFVNQILPSGGLSGITYLAYGFRSNLETGKTTLIQLGRYIFAFLAYLLMLPIAIALLIQEGSFSKFSDVLSETFSNPLYFLVVASFFAFVIMLAVALFSRSFSSKMGAVFIRVFGWFKRTVMRNPKPVTLKPLKKINHEFHEGMNFVKEGGVRTITPSVYMLFSAIAELAIVYISLLAVGADVSIAAVFIAFVAANIVGVVSIIPGDVGVHEAAVIVVFSAFGVPQPVAISATLLYRVFNKLIFLPIGFYFYQNILKPALD